MAELFHLSPAAIGVHSALKIARFSEEQAYKLMHSLRWGSSDKQACPECESFRKHHFIKSRKQYRCAENGCGKSFSITSGTKFAYHKKPLRDILYAAALLVNGVEGAAALRNAQNIGVRYTPILVFNHKLREALFETRDVTKLSGEVEIDGCYFHYYVRPKNNRKDRVDRRLLRNMNPNKRAVIVLRQRGPKEHGAVRTIVEVIKYENEADIRALVHKYVELGSTIYTDEHMCYTHLAAEYELHQVNHQEHFSSPEGYNENQAESFFNRNRKLFGHIHKCAPKYLLFYSNEMAWQEDNRRKSFSWRFEDLIRKCLTTGQSKYWSKYFQGNHRTEDTLFAAT